MGRPKSEIRVKQRADSGAYIASFVEAPGRWHASPAATRPEALKWAKRHRDELLGKTATKLRAYAEGFFDEGGDWLARMRDKGRTYGAAHLANRRGYLENFVIPLWGDEIPGELTARRVDDDLLVLKSKHGRILSGATKNKVAGTLSIILGDLAERGIIPRNPLDHMKPYSKTPIAPRAALPRETIAKLYPATHGELVRVWGSAMWSAIMCIFNDTGLRPGEIRALRWREWFPEERFFPVRHGIAAHTEDEVKGLKTEGKGVAVKPAFVSERTRQEIEIWRAESNHAEPNDFIFSEDGRKPLSNEGIVKAFRRGLKGQGIDAQNWTPYWLRHSFGTYALEGLDDSELFRLMGHTNLATSGIYRHPDDLTVLRSALAIRDKLDAMREPVVLPFKERGEA